MHFRAPKGPPTASKSKVHTQISCSAFQPANPERAVEPDVCTVPVECQNALLGPMTLVKLLMVGSADLHVKVLH